MTMTQILPERVSTSEMILLVTSKDDLTTDYLILRLASREIPFFRFNTEDVLKQYQVRLNVFHDCSSFTIADTARNAEVRSDEITGAYFRKPRPPITLLNNSNPVADRFNAQEVREMLRSTWRLLPKKRWLNDPEALWSASNKIKQLDLAAKVGFSVPATLVSTDPSEVFKFISKHDHDVIGKAVKNGFVQHDLTQTVIFTTALRADDIQELCDSPTVLPMIVQPRLRKEVDLRITIVGDQLFPVALDSQSHEDTSTDWRTWEVTNDVDLRHSVFDLPKTVERNCIELNRRLGLRFSCVDMVLSPEGDFTFLEVNPNGQWAWIEQKLDVPIRDRIIDELTKYGD